MRLGDVEKVHTWKAVRLAYGSNINHVAGVRNMIGGGSLTETLCGKRETSYTFAPGLEENPRYCQQCVKVADKYGIVLP